MESETKTTLKVCTVIFIVIVGVTGLLMTILPRYGVWQRALKGKSRLREAEWSKQIAVEKAKALLDASSLKAQAEVERAKGVAQANQIIGKSLKDNEGYLRYLWIQGLQDGSSEVIYIPTEAGLPILEAGKR